MTLTVTVLIPAHNEAETIQQVVRSSWHQTHRPQAVIVIDDGSTDRTAELAKDAGAQVVTSAGGSKARALNVGLKSVTTDVVVGVDADSTLAPDAIELLVASLAAGYDATSATVMPQQKRGLFVRSRRFSYSITCTWWRMLQKQVGRLQCLSGCGWAVRTEALRRMGGIPTDLVSDARNTTWGLYATGARVTYTPKAVVYTHEPESFRVYHAQMRRWASSFFQVISKHKQELRKPSALFVVATTTFDVVTVPILYLLSYMYLLQARQYPALGLWFAFASLMSVVISARTIGWKEAVLCFLPNKIVMPLDKWIYFWTFVREWILGRRYSSWTGRQGRKTVISPMTTRRKLSLSSVPVVVVTGLALWGRPTTSPSSASVPSALAAEPLPLVQPPTRELPASAEWTPVVPWTTAVVETAPSPSSERSIVSAAGSAAGPGPTVTAANELTGSQPAIRPAPEITLPLAAPPAPQSTPKPEPEPTPEPATEPEPTPEPADGTEPAPEAKTEPEQEQASTSDTSTETEAEPTTQTEQT